MDPTAPASPAPLLVACLCAQWCRTCEAYRDAFAASRDAFARAHPGGLRFAWVDVEDESELVGDLDIEDFPTVLIARGADVLFFGTVMPHAQTLDRLVRSALEGAPALAPESLEPDVRALPGRLADHAPP